MRISSLIVAPVAALVLGPALGVGHLLAQEPEAYHITEGDLAEDRVYSPYAGTAHADQVFFGDVHVHTNLSFDAGLFGTTLDAHDGFRLARGEKVASNSGQPVQLIRPLDFLAITDHAEMIGLAPAIREANPTLLSEPWGRWVHERFNSGAEGRVEAVLDVIAKGTSGVNPFGSDDLTRSIWGDFIKIADQYNEPGSFTAIIGFEWTSTPDGDNLHRVVLFRDDADKAGQVLPFSLFDSQDPEDLWAYLAAYEKKTGGQALAIPHNGNLSNGLMFSDKNHAGEPMSRAYAEARIRWEPIMEATQIKGDGETHPLLSSEDEFADYETWDVGNIDGSSSKEDWMLQYEYARSALKLGLELGKELGANPYKFGLSAASDSHTALATTREENYFGKYAKTEPGPNRQHHDVIPADDPALIIMTSQEVSSGLTAVWARENSREALFDAMKRKEVYATTGTRMRVRVFGGWDFEADEVARPDFASQGYRRGVPMGGTLFEAPDGGTPRFMIRALRDPDGANLDRIQIIKGWLDAAGKLPRTHLRCRRLRRPCDRHGRSLPGCRRLHGRRLQGRVHQHDRGCRPCGLLGLIPISTRISTPSTMYACSRSRHHGGQPTTRRSSASICPTMYRRPSRTAPIRRRSGIRRRRAKG